MVDQRFDATRMGGTAGKTSSPVALKRGVRGGGVGWGGGEWWTSVFMPLEWAQQKRLSPWRRVFDWGE